MTPEHPQQIGCIIGGWGSHSAQHSPLKAGTQGVSAPCLINPSQEDLNA